MGYTHYWTQTQEFTSNEWKTLVGFTKAAFALAKKQGRKLAAEYDSAAPPVANREVIVFNGVGDLGHETFYLQRKLAHDAPSFCKTARKPYDMVACAVLLAARGKKIKVSSDGAPGIDAEWDDAISFYNEVATSVQHKLVDAEMVRAFLREDNEEEQMEHEIGSESVSAEGESVSAEGESVGEDEGEPWVHKLPDGSIELFTVAGIYARYYGKDPGESPIKRRVAPSDPNYWSVQLTLSEYNNRVD